LPLPLMGVGRHAVCSRPGLALPPPVTGVGDHAGCSRPG
jgi:hypothetical protein